jgi:hypothetical protein
MDMRRTNRRKEDEMRRAMWIAVALLVILGGVAIGVGAYHAGVNHGLALSDHAVQVIREYPGGFFPFGLFLFPLFLFAIFALVRGLAWRGRWGGHGPRRWDAEHGDWAKRRSDMFEDWHRRQHEQASGDHPGAGGQPAAV